VRTRDLHPDWHRGRPQRPGRPGQADPSDRGCESADRSRAL